MTAIEWQLLWVQSCRWGEDVDFSEIVIDINSREGEASADLATTETRGSTSWAKRCWAKKWLPFFCPYIFLPRTSSLLKRRIDGGVRANSSA